MTIGFSKKRIEAKITLATGSFDSSTPNSVTLSGLRMTADMTKAGGESMGSLQLRVFGLTQAMMNQLTIIGPYGNINLGNQIEISAGDENGMQLVFFGVISAAWADYNSAPEVALNVVAYAGIGDLVKPVSPSSYSSASTDVATIMGDLAKIMGLAFEANDVQAKLNYPYFSGTALTQVRACARAAQIFYSIDRGTLAIWGVDGGRVGEIPLISAQTGMVGYPTLSSQYIVVTTLFNWNIRNGGYVQLNSSIPAANGILKVGAFSHSLSSEILGGPWFTTFDCIYA